MTIFLRDNTFPTHFSVHQQLNKSLPLDYNFRFVIEEISNINDKEQSMTIHMYFAVMWLEPRLVINQSAVEWDEDRSHSNNQKYYSRITSKVKSPKWRDCL